MRLLTATGGNVETATVCHVQALADMKAAKHQGTYADLNIWTTMLQNDVLGCAPTHPDRHSSAAVPQSMRRTIDLLMNVLSARQAPSWSYMPCDLCQ